MIIMPSNSQKRFIPHLFWNTKNGAGFIPHLFRTNMSGFSPTKECIRPHTDFTNKKNPKVNSRSGKGAGFTLIELLVVIAVISMLLSLIMVVFGTTRARARDAERELEVKSMQDALELYFASFRTYPISAGPIVLTRTDPVSLAMASGDAISEMPLDPLNAGVYVYTYDSSAGSTYTLTYYLETDTIYLKNPGLQTVTPGL